MRSSSILTSILSPVVAFGILAVTIQPAQADVITQQRCAQDSLTIQQAEQRLGWARKCALTLHTNGPGDFFEPGDVDITGAMLKEYIDDKFVNRRYTGGPDFHVNETFRFYLYSSGGTTQITEPVTNFFKWTRVVKKTRPFYPTFGDKTDINTALLLKPSSNPDDCNLYYSNGTIATSFYVNAYCDGGCYTPEQEVLFPDGYQRIDEAAARLQPMMITLTAESTLDDVRFMTNDVQSYTVDIRDAEHKIFEIRAASGGALRLTDQHPVVLGTGQLVQARTLQVGDHLIREDGSLDAIVSVEEVHFWGKAYNLKPQTTDPVSNLLIAQGYIVGSSRFQNDDIGYINRMIMGQGIPEELFPE